MFRSLILLFICSAFFACKQRQEDQSSSSKEVEMYERSRPSWIPFSGVYTNYIKMRCVRDTGTNIEYVLGYQKYSESGYGDSISIFKIAKSEFAKLPVRGTTEEQEEAFLATICQREVQRLNYYTLIGKALRGFNRDDQVRYLTIKMTGMREYGEELLPTKTFEFYFE